ncbi:MAG: hypothetical protein WBD05_04200, partial [Phycisphaerae bacterium]
MEEFPRTSIEGVSVARLLIGINWFLGFSHTSQAKDRFINEYMTAERIAPIIEVFLSAGVDGMVGTRPDEKLMKAIARAEDRTGRRCITLALPTLSVADGPEAAGENARILDAQAATGATFCLPHQQTTDALLDRTTRTIRRMDRVCTMIRDRGMIPGLSTHMPETVPYADEMGLDVATYVQIYNAAGFLMQVELDWVHRIIWNAKRPVIVIKPLAAGRLMPLAGLAFTWATIRDKDMVCVGTQSPDEAREVIEISLSLL